MMCFGNQGRERFSPSVPTTEYELGLSKDRGMSLIKRAPNPPNLTMFNRFKLGESLQRFVFVEVLFILQ